MKATGKKEIIDLIPRLKGIYADYAACRDYRPIRNLALFANEIKRECMRIMDTFDYIDPEQRARE